MNKQVKILLQTTIPFAQDDWHIGRFEMLASHLRSLTDDSGNRIYEVIARDRQPDANGIDPLLEQITVSDFDQVWLFGVDDGNGLSPAECEALTKFRENGGGILSTRDHHDLGSSLCNLGGIGASHYFHTTNQDPDPERCCRDDQATTNIDWPNYHSGANGDFQTILASDHELLRRKDGSLIEYFPAHPHEGGIGATDPSSRVIATSTSKVTGRQFNLIVVHEPGDGSGRAIAESSFHHLVDYNWNTDAGCPSFLEEPPGDQFRREPEKLEDIRQYVENAAKWLSRTADRVNA